MMSLGVDVRSYTVPMVSYMQWVRFHKYIECVMSEIQALCDVTHIVNVISYTVDDMSYIVHVMS